MNARAFVSTSEGNAPAAAMVNIWPRYRKRSAFVPILVAAILQRLSAREPRFTADFEHPEMLRAQQHLEAILSRDTGILGVGVIYVIIWRERDRTETLFAGYRAFARAFTVVRG